MSIRKVVFSDIDGVLNSDAFADYMLTDDNVDIFREDMLDPRALSQLKKIVEATGSSIVISSSWRWDRNAMKSVRQQLREKGIDYVGTTTLQMDITLSHGKEIQAWLDEHPEVENYVILDDDDMVIPELMPHHVKTNFKYGLTRERAEEAIKILNSEVKNG